MEMTTAFLLSTLCTFLMSTLGQDTSVPLPEFVTHPKEYSFIVRQQPVTLTCEAYDAMDITFNCTGVKIDAERLQIFRRFVPGKNRTLVKATTDVSQNDVKGFEDYWCECYAWTSAGAMTNEDENTPLYVRSRRGFVMVPYLQKEFYEEPISQVVEEDSEVELRCSAPDGNPEPTIFWEKGGQFIDPEVNSNMLVTDSGSLVIQNFQMNDEGDYTCVAKNLAGKVKSAPATLSLQDYIMAGETHLYNEEMADEPADTKFLIKPEKMYYVTENSPVPMTCQVRGVQIIEFRCNGDRISEKRVDKEVENERNPADGLITAVYRIAKTDVDEQKRRGKELTCTCYAWYIENGNWAGEESSAGIIKPAELDANFGANMDDMTVAPGSTVSFRCQPPRGIPKPKVIWTLNGQQVSDSAKIRIAGNTLTIQQVSARESGEVACIAQNVAGTREMRASLRISDEAQMVDSSKETTDFPTTLMTTPPPGTPFFTENLETLYYTSRSNPATLICGVRSASILTFRCNSERLPQDQLKVEQDYNRETNEQSIRASVEIPLSTVKKSTRKGGPAYGCMCVAWYSKPDGSWGTLESVRSIIKPAFLESEFRVNPTDVTVSPGRNAVFNCVPPSGGPEPMVSWTKDNQKIDTSKRRFEITEDDSLTIFNVKRRDEGAYVCVAENGAGTSYSAAARLTVSGDMVTEPVIPEPETTEPPQPETTEEMIETTTEFDLASGIPIFIRQPDPVSYIIRNRPATITCRTLGAEYLTFACDEKRIPEAFDDTYSAIDPETNRKILERSINVTRESVEEKTDGDYMCTCSGWYADTAKKGWAQLNKTGKVEIAFIRKHFHMEPVSKTVDAGDAVEIPCGAPNANPEPTITWERDGVPLDEDADHNILVSSSGSLIFNQILLEDEGNYTCVAENIVGKRFSMAAEIKVTEEDGTVVEPEPEPETTPEPEPETVEPVVSIAVDGPPVFHEQLEKTSYVVQGGSVTLTCSAKQTGKISFMCNEEEIDDERVILEDVEDEGEMILKASLEIMSKTVEGLEEEYACECLAWYKLSENEPEQYVNSGRGIIELAFIGEKFAREPMDQSATIGQMVTFKCAIPDGFPYPMTSWTKNGEEINFDSNDNLVMPGDGSLVIVQVRVSDAGSYTCSATNIAGTRTSRTAMLTVQGDTTTSMPEPEPESTVEMIEGNFTDGETNVTSEVMPTAEYTTESMPENTTMYIELGTDGAVIEEDSTPEPEPEGGSNGSAKELPHPKCIKLQMCYSAFLMKMNPAAFDTHEACPDLQQFLNCAHDAMAMCDIDTEASPTLTDISDWFNEFCTRLPRRENVQKKCSAYKRCGPPVDLAITPEKLIDVKFWCKYITQTTQCRQTAVVDAQCKVMKKMKMKSDLHYLEGQVQKYCPAEVQVTKPVTGIKVDEVEDKDKEGSASMTTASILVSTIVQVLALLVISFR